MTTGTALRGEIIIGDLKYSSGPNHSLASINLANREDNLPYYTMTGIKVNKPASGGVYIHGNRKIVVR